MLKQIGITAALLAAAVFFQPVTASAQERNDRGGYAAWNDRGRDHHDGNWNRDRREDRDYPRGEQQWRERGRLENRYDRNYYTAPPYAYGYDYSGARRCR